MEIVPRDRFVSVIFPTRSSEMNTELHQQSPKYIQLFLVNVALDPIPFVGAKQRSRNTMKTTVRGTNRKALPGKAGADQTVLSLDMRKKSICFSSFKHLSAIMERNQTTFQLFFGLNDSSFFYTFTYSFSCD